MQGVIAEAGYREAHEVKIVPSFFFVLFFFFSFFLYFDRLVRGFANVDRRPSKSLLIAGEDKDNSRFTFLLIS